MPTNHFNSLEELYQNLTDFEIEDDSTKQGIPCAIVKVPHVGKIKVTQVNDYYYHETLIKMRERMLSYFANKMLMSQTKVDMNRVQEQIKNLVEDLSNLDDKEAMHKVQTMTYLFEDKNVRYDFFKSMKKMKMIPFWVTWKRWQMNIYPHHTLTFFILLWAFNFDGLKKKIEILLRVNNTISHNMNTASHIESINSMNVDTLTKHLKSFHEREKASQTNSKESSTSGQNSGSGENKNGNKPLNTINKKT